MVRKCLGGRGQHPPVRPGQPGLQRQQVLERQPGRAFRRAARWTWLVSSTAAAWAVSTRTGWSAAPRARPLRHGRLSPARSTSRSATCRSSRATSRTSSDDLPRHRCRSRRHVHARATARPTDGGEPDPAGRGWRRSGRVGGHAGQSMFDDCSSASIISECVDTETDPAPRAHSFGNWLPVRAHAVPRTRTTSDTSRTSIITCSTIHRCSSPPPTVATTWPPTAATAAATNVQVRR
jgi:hypothetical protein